MRSTTILTGLTVGALAAAATLAITAVGPTTGAGEAGGGGCGTGSYTAAVLERDRQMTAQMGAATTMAMAGDSMLAHSRDPAFLRALECQVREVESMFGRVTPPRP